MPYNTELKIARETVQGVASEVPRRDFAKGILLGRLKVQRGAAISTPEASLVRVTHGVTGILRRERPRGSYDQRVHQNRVTLVTLAVSMLVLRDSRDQPIASKSE